MSTPKINDFGVIRDMTPEEIAELAASQPPALTQAQARAQWEAAARKRAAVLLKTANDVLGQMRSGYAFGSDEHTFLSGLISQFNTLAQTTNLASSTNEASAYALINTAYLALVASATTPLKAQYAQAISLRRTAGEAI